MQPESATSPDDSVALPPTLRASLGERFGGVARALPQFAFLALQLALLVLAIRVFRLESWAYQQLAYLTLAGFAIHYWLPSRLRLPFFLLLSLAGLAMVMGLASMAVIVGIGGALLGICHLPVAFGTRVGLLIATAAGLALARSGAVELPIPAAVWPILGSIFMFRLIIYVYDLRHEKTPPGPLQSLSYFFLLPNVCFPLFPVIDFTTFRRTYYDAEPAAIHQRGLHWMLRGIVHLLLYRAVYYFGVISPAEVDGPLELVRYLVTNFALYLRVSGHFHLIIGMLHLFGFHLPETNHRYMLASSFTDFWRRINIYWKDFMVKVFYYPAYFRLRRGGETRAIVLSTLFVFLATWLLHSYQWFWLRGSFPITPQDILFWGVLAGLVVHNSLRESSPTARARARARKAAKGLRPFLAEAARTLGVFATICVLWSLWTAESLGAWLTMWSAALRGAELPAPSVLLEGVLWLAAGAAALWIGARLAPLARQPAAIAGAITALCVIGAPPVYKQLDPAVAGVIESLRARRLSDADAARLERGYYENLIGVDRFNSPLWEIYMRRPADWPSLHETEAARRLEDFSKFELVPSFSFQYHGQLFTTNRWGMRDREYEQTRPPGTFRAALLGSSHAMGSGVADGEAFEALLEQRLVQEPLGSFDHYEVLNFAVSGYSPLQQLRVLRERALPFEPDALFYVAHAVEKQRAIQHLAQALRSGVDIPYPFLVDVVRRAGVDADMPMPMIERGLDSFGAEILRWTYGELVATCRERGIVPVLVLLPIPRKSPPEPLVREVVALAEESGFLVVEDAFGVYDGRDVDDLVVAEWDNHANASAHRLLADAIYAALARRETAVFGAAPAPR